MSVLQQLYSRLFDEETRKRIYKWRNPGHYQRMRIAVHPSPKGSFSLKPFDQHECIFVHITKSAGTSVALALFDYLPYHHTARDYRVIYGRKTFERYFKFAFVRNPWDRLYSAYSYLKGGGWDDDDKKWADTYLSAFDSFESFVIGAFDKSWLSRHLHFKPQIEFIGDRANRPLIDHLMYFETIAADYNVLSQRLGLDSRLEHRNPSKRAGYREIYTEPMKAIVAEAYAEDIACFGYEFDGIAQRMQVIDDIWTPDER